MATDKIKALPTNLLLLLLALTMTGCPEPICFNPGPSYSFAVTACFTPEQQLNNSAINNLTMQQSNNQPNRT